jgi:hypothetical protein
LRAYRPRLVDQLFMPDIAEPSFRRGDGTPIEYALQTISVVVVDDNDKPARREATELVVATGKTDASD